MLPTFFFFRGICVSVSGSSFSINAIVERSYKQQMSSVFAHTCLYSIEIYLKGQGHVNMELQNLFFSLF